MFDGGFEPEIQVAVNGGSSAQQSENGCEVGAAGTLYYKQSERLIVDNKNRLTQQATSIDAYTVGQMAFAANHMTVTG